MGWEIDKTFEFCYGHRVHTQVLNGYFADNLKCACRHLHGHEGKVQVFLSGDKLDDTGMITDFRHLEWLKKKINEVIDHKFIIDRNDPLFDKIVGFDKKFEQITVVGGKHGMPLPIGNVIDLFKSGIEQNTPEYEYYEGLFIVDFVPTSENLSKWMADFVDYVMIPLNVTVGKVDWWETPKSRSTYIRNRPIFKNGIRSELL